MNSTPVHVVAGVLSDAHGRILLTQRPAGKHLAGLWEFPGGKCEAGESADVALRRELREEIGVVTGAIERLIAVPWRYPEKSIFLDVYRVLDHDGAPHGREGQALCWAGIDEFAGIAMPPADCPVVAALRLPPCYVITPEPGNDDATFLHALTQVLDTGARLVQLRSKRLAPEPLRTLAQAAQVLAAKAGAQLLINGHIDLARELALDGVHLPAAELMRLRSRPLGYDRWVAASCHNEIELAHAARIGVDFAVLGPVNSTASHSDSIALGWQRFAQLREAAAFPVFALGGLGSVDLPRARRAGAQGVAGISAFWPVP